MFQLMNHGTRILAAAVGVMSMGAAARAHIIVTFSQDPGANDTVVLVQGNLNTAQFPVPTTGVFEGGSTVFPAIGAVGSQRSPVSANQYSFSTPFILPYGSGFNTSGTFLHSDVFMLYPNTASDHQLRLPANYVSGTPLASASIFVGTFASLGITPSQVVMNLPGAQTITLRFVTVPGPGSGLLLCAGVLAPARRLRRR